MSIRTANAIHSWFTIGLFLFVLVGFVSVVIPKIIFAGQQQDENAVSIANNKTDIAVIKDRVDRHEKNIDSMLARLDSMDSLLVKMQDGTAANAATLDTIKYLAMFIVVGVMGTLGTSVWKIITNANVRHSDDDDPGRNGAVSLK